jgi:hypothetical protein
MPDACAHIAAVQGVKLPQRKECAECVQTGGRWVHLGTCQSQRKLYAGREPAKSSASTSSKALGWVHTS